VMHLHVVVRHHQNIVFGYPMRLPFFIYKSLFQEIPIEFGNDPGLFLNPLRAGIIIGNDKVDARRFEKGVRIFTNEVSIKIFEKITKEGRKYGVELVVISQCPSEVTHTELSQCNNLVTMHLTNAEDQSVVRRLLPAALENMTAGANYIIPVPGAGLR